MTPFGCVSQPIFQFLVRFHHQRPLAPPSGSHHLRMGPRPHDDRQATILLRLAHQLMDAPDVGTGGVQDLRPAGPELLIHRLALPMGADDDPAALRHLLGAVHAAHPLFRQGVHHVGVVDDRTQHNAGLAVLGGLLGQLHRTLHAVAESGGLGYSDGHSISSFKA